jgi:hypothetical protein
MMKMLINASTCNGQVKHNVKMIAACHFKALAFYAIAQ